MPFSLLIAIFLAFGIDGPAGIGPIPRPELPRRVGEVAGGIALIGLLAFALGRLVALRIERRGGTTPAIRRSYVLGSRGVQGLTLGVFGWIIHGVGWPAVVASGFGLGGVVLVEEFLVLLPFLLAQLVGWWGLYAGERAIRIVRGAGGPVVGPGRYLVLKMRQSLGLVLPVALVFSLGQDLLRRSWPTSAEDPRVQLGWMAAMGSLVLALAPAFVRLTWPTRTLPPGPLRDRLERLARRFRFRCTDILIWDTGQSLVNAGVTGALPWFRYVLLTDAMVEQLKPHQVEAVFGHEIGHIAHRHMIYFGFFILGSIGAMTLVQEGSVRSLRYLGFPDIDSLLAGLLGLHGSTALTVVQATTVLVSLALYFLLVFGFLSRRLERQADVFGCRAVSCDRAGCPPHADVNGPAGVAPRPRSLCPVGIRIFIDALSDVASLNGMERTSRWSWRHGSIARRIAFLETLSGRPDAEHRFQVGVRRLQVGLAVLLGGALIAALRTGALERLQ